ncbi:nicotinate-nucleotide adenylyltransferase [Marinomonas epiphytica]
MTTKANDLSGSRNSTGLAIMGGTFDPIHNGHLRTAVEILDLYGFEQLKLIPCFQPVHKGRPSVSAQQRLTMVKMAISSDARLQVDDREILRSGPSYTIDTLASIRQEVGVSHPIVMVLGMDSFLSLPTWQNWQKLLDYAHILVVSRPGWEPDLITELSELCEKSRALSIAELQCAPAGRILMKTLTPLGISSSMIRSLHRESSSIAYLLPEPVQKYICDNNLYQ